MVLRSATRGAVLLGLLALLGCYYPVREKIDATLCDIAKQPLDIQKLPAADQAPLMPPAEDGAIKQTAAEADEGEPEEDLLLAAAQTADKGEEQPKELSKPRPVL